MIKPLKPMKTRAKVRPRTRQGPVAMTAVKARHDRVRQ